MKAVWSFWSKPFERYARRVWTAPKHHLQAWGLSLHLARQHYPETQLITDSPGKNLLVDALGLQFGEVSTELDSLADADCGWWMLGKLLAYSLQERPFVHLDTDVFLWRELPLRLASAPVFAQCPERHSLHPLGPLREIEGAFSKHELRLPLEWTWASSRGTEWFRQENCGILGGNRPDFIRHYARTALNLVLNPKHQHVWNNLPYKHEFNMILEQFLLGACIDYHAIAPESPYRGINIRYLFPSWSEAYNQATAARLGYTHLIADAKSHPAVTDRLEKRMLQLDRSFTRHCERVAQRFYADV